MRSLNVGIVGLALVGVAAIAPQEASAYASYSVDVKTDVSASIDQPGTLSFWNFFGGEESFKSVPTGNSSSYTNPTNSTTATSSEFDVLMTGEAFGVSSTYEGHRSNYTDPSMTAVFSNAQTLGTIFRITDLEADANLDLSLAVDYLLETTVGEAGSNATAYMNWFVSYQERPKGSSRHDWSDWSPYDGSFFAADSEIDGEKNWSSHRAENGGSLSGTDPFVLEDIVLDGEKDYRWRLSLEIQGMAESAGTTPTNVPLPAALPMLGAAMAGLGLFAARRRKS